MIRQYRVLRLLPDTVRSTLAPMEPTTSAPKVTVRSSRQSKKSNGAPVAPKAPRAKKVQADKSIYPADFEGLTPPQSLKINRRYGDKEYVDRWGNKSKGILHLPSLGPASGADIMFVSPCVLQEELSDRTAKPMMLKGPAANLFLRNVHKSGFKDSDFRYSALVRYNVPKLKPNREDINWSLPLFTNELREYKPKIVVCLGKAPFDLLAPCKLKADEVRGGVFKNDEFDCLVYLMDSVVLPFLKPEYIERVLIDLRELKRIWHEIQGVKVERVGLEYYHVQTIDELDNITRDLVRKETKILSIDCEWAGKHHVDGQLRSHQFCWAPGKAAYIDFMDENGQRTIDVDDATVGKVLAPLYNSPNVRYVGHYLATDMLWIKHKLGVEVYKKAAFDTMFAQQVINEYSDLKLERLAVCYTDLGRYDIELLLWKKMNQFKENDGYAKIPTKVLLPYSCRDVDTVLRTYPQLIRQLIMQGLLEYYYQIHLPFVTDCYLSKMETGLPIDQPYAEKMREIFLRNQRMLVTDFKEEIRKESNRLLVEHCMKFPAEQAVSVIQLLVRPEVPDSQKLEALKAMAGPERLASILPVFLHWQATHQIDPENPKVGFNVNSTDHLKRWLFDVKGYTPIKTTKRDNIQMAWEKVKNFPKERWAEFEPACDKQTLKIYADRDPLVARIEELKAVGNIVKSFLREPDPDTGEEQGIFKWIASDGRLHTNFACTETGRPRCVHEDTEIPCRTGVKRIKDIRPGDEVWTHNSRWRKVMECYILPPEEMYEVTFSNGQILKATYNHRLLTQEGKWLHLRDVYQQETPKRYATMPESPVFRASDRLCRSNGDADREVPGLAGDTSHRRESAEQQHRQLGSCDPHGTPCDSSTLQVHASGVTITRIVPCGRYPVYDIAVEEDHSYEAAGCFSHNCWNPNILNWPKNITKPIEAGFKRINEKLAAMKRAQLEAELVAPPLIEEAVKAIMRQPTTLRSCIKAPPGWCFVEFDFATAEVVALGYLSGDQNMIDAVTKPDPQFGLKLIEDTKSGRKEEKPLRIAYINSISAVPVNAQDPALLHDPNDSALLRNPDGTLKHPKQDIHWRMAETFQGLPREKLNKERDRGAGKIGNFGIPYGATPTLIERQIETLTGQKPEPGTGEKIINAYKTNFPAADRYLTMCEEGVVDPGYFRSLSGRIRHFNYGSIMDLDGVSEGQRKSILSPLLREARNYPMQELIAASAARANVMLLDEFMTRGMQARIMLVLYDAITVLCPLEELRMVRQLMPECMSARNTWQVKGRTMQLDVDESISIRWATKLNKEEVKLLEPYM